MTFAVLVPTFTNVPNPKLWYAVYLWYVYRAYISTPIFSRCPLHTNSGCGKIDALIDWSMVIKKHPLLELP